MMPTKADQITKEQVSAPAGQAEAMASPRKRYPEHKLLLVFVLFSAGIIAAGSSFFWQHKKTYTIEAHRQLSAITEMKVRELAQWREDKKADAAIFFKNPSFFGLVRRFLDNPDDAHAQRHLKDWVITFSTTEDFDLISLLDTQGVVRLCMPDRSKESMCEHVSESVEALTSGQIIIQDFHRHQDNQQFYLAVWVPIFDETDANRPLGVLSLRIVPEKYLFPFLEKWPMPSATAETQLVRRDGNDVVFLSGLRDQANTSRGLRVSLKKNDILAVKAALGQTGILSGVKDYRGVPVIAAIQAVPNSPWVLVAKVDKAELMAPLYVQLWELIILILSLLLFFGAGVMHVLRHQRILFYREKATAAEKLLASESQYRELFELSGDALLLIDCKSGQIIEANAMATKLYGYERDELLARKNTDLSAEPEETRRCMKEVASKSDQVFWIPLRLHRKKDGTIFPIEISVRSLMRGGQSVLIAACRDITQRKQDEAARKQQTEEAEVARDQAKAANQRLQQEITEHKAAEEALQASEEHHRLLLQYLPVGVVVHARDTSVLFANQEAELLMGLSIEMMQGKKAIDPAWHLVREDGSLLPVDEYPVSRVLATGKPLENLLLGVDRYMCGDRVWLLVNAFPQLDEAGQVRQVDVTLMDLTERKRLEAALEQRLATLDNERLQLRTLIDNLPYSIYVKDKECRFLVVNQALLQRIGVASPEILIGHGDENFHPAELARQYRDDDLRIMREGIGFYGKEEQVLIANRGLRWSSTTKAPIKNAEGDVIGLVGIGIDITERKRTESYREMRREIIQLLNEPGDLPDVLQRVISAVKTTTGFDAVGLRLQEGEDFPYYSQDGFPPEFLLMENTLLKRGADGGICRDKDGNVSLECTCGLIISGKTDPTSQLFTKGGSFWTNNSLPLLDLPADQDPRHHPRNTCMHRDYASLALIPVRDKERIIGLIHLADRRKDCFTRENVELLENIAIYIGEALMRRKAEKALHEIAESKAKFASTVAHELRSPLAMIKESTNIIMDEIMGPLNIEQKEMLRVSKNNIERLGRLINNVLALQKIDAKKMDYDLQEHDVNDVVKEAHTNAMLFAGERNADVMMELGAEIPRIKFDADKIMQVLINLLANAIKYSENGPVVIQTRLANNDVQISVRDSGQGVNPEELDEIFKPFVQGKGRKKGGTGLGLAITKEIVLAHHGRIWVESEVGKGSTFYFALPVGQVGQV